MRANPIVALVLLIALPWQSAQACMWDSDTLATEAAGKGRILDVIVGRFPRNPPVYYEARLARVSKEIVVSPGKLELYDDAGVACDRLNRSDQAITWMEKKAAILARQSDKEHQYRYHANLGTFLIHKWLAAGAEPADLAGAEGAEHIRKAIEINPDAHFGREAVQLQAIEWLLIERAEGVIDPNTFPTPINLFQQVAWHGYADREGVDEKTIEGLAGMVALGAAWESVDIFRTLGVTLSAEGDASLAFLADLRVQQLIRSGKKSWADQFPEEYPATARGLKDSEPLMKWFVKARESADAWQSARTAFIEKQIAAGKHPDTHPDFWKGFDENKYKAPRLPHQFRPMEMIRIILIAVISLLVILVGARIWRRLSGSTN